MLFGHFKLRAATVALTFAVSALSANAGGGSDPEVVLDEIYGQVDAMCGGDGQGSPYDIYAIAAAFFVPELAEPFEKAMEANELGFDVLVDGQDCKVSDLAIEVVDTDEDSAVGRATFTNFGEDRVIDLHMTKDGDAWMVSDIVYQHRPFSLKEAL